MTNLIRTTFTTSRQAEFFTQKELTMQLGYPQALWPLVIAKELVDNSLDAAESLGVPPEIAIILDVNSITVADNGPGLPASTIEKALDYETRTSDKRHYCAPSRGQLGNALKCVFPAAFVATGQKSIVEITACGIHHRIEADIDRIAQKPRITHAQTPMVKNGTTVTLHWPEIACSESTEHDSDFYRGRLPSTLAAMVRDFAAVNPHASFSLAAPGGKMRFTASDPGWRKWLPTDRTSSHWYPKDLLVELIGAHIAEERRTGAVHRSVRDFIGDFDGLAGTVYMKRAVQAAGLAGRDLASLAIDGDIDINAAERLLQAMQSISKPVKPERLGVIGRQHMQAALVSYGASAESVEYGREAKIGDDRLPFVVEVAFGITRENCPRKLVCGLNHSLVFRVPSPSLYGILSDCYMGRDEPVAIIVHQSCPRFAFTGHGKGSL